MALFERLFIFSNEKGKEPVLTPLKSDLKAGNPDLLENNWVALKMDKKTFMETNCEGFAIHIRPGNLYEEINVSSKKLKVHNLFCRT